MQNPAETFRVFTKPEDIPAVLRCHCHTDNPGTRSLGIIENTPVAAFKQLCRKCTAVLVDYNPENQAKPGPEIRIKKKLKPPQLGTAIKVKHQT